MAIVCSARNSRRGRRRSVSRDRTSSYLHSYSAPTASVNNLVESQASAPLLADHATPTASAPSGRRQPITVVMGTPVAEQRRTSSPDEDDLWGDEPIPRVDSLGVLIADPEADTEPNAEHAPASERWGGAHADVDLRGRDS